MRRPTGMGRTPPQPDRKTCPGAQTRAQLLHNKPFLLPPTSAEENFRFSECSVVPKSHYGPRVNIRQAIRRRITSLNFIDFGLPSCVNDRGECGVATYGDRCRPNVMSTPPRRRLTALNVPRSNLSAGCRSGADWSCTNSGGWLGDLALEGRQRSLIRGE